MQVVQPMVTIPALERAGTDHIKRPLERLMDRNRAFLAEFERNALFKLVSSEAFRPDTVKARFLDLFQVWSDKYQKMVLARAVVCESPRFAKITQQHLAEEFGHNTDLAKLRNGRPAIWDPVLEATASWFPWRILTLSEIEKIVLVHTVVESSATIFYRYVRPAVRPDGASDPHFAQHEVVDHTHQDMGKEELENLTDRDYARLEEVQAEGWTMLNAVMSRIAELTVKAAPLD